LWLADMALVELNTATLLVGEESFEMNIASTAGLCANRSPGGVG